MRIVVSLSLFLIAAAVASFTCGCGVALRVRQSASSLPGVPFYVKEAVCTRQTVSVMPFYQLTLETVINGKTSESETTTVSAAYYLTDKTAQQFVSFLNGTADTSRLTTEGIQTTLSDDWEAIKKSGGIEPHAMVGTWPEYLTSNESAPKIYVNYGKVLYLNGKNPISGSAKVDFKLASDGTLTEASSEITNDTVKTVLSALPISDLIKSGAGLGLKSTSAAGTASLQLRAEGHILKIMRSQSTAFEAGCPDHDGFDNSRGIGITIEDVGSEGSASSPKQDDGSVSFSGKIVLPTSVNAISADKTAGKKVVSDGPNVKAP